MSRIEVLKGPQGTLFGKNTSAGVINIITEAPSFTPEFNGELNVGNYGAMGASGSVRPDQRHPGLPPVRRPPRP
jgi:outer membrane receptor protein involved in Fe transport